MHFRQGILLSCGGIPAVLPAGCPSSCPAPWDNGSRPYRERPEEDVPVTSSLTAFFNPTDEATCATGRRRSPTRSEPDLRRPPRL